MGCAGMRAMLMLYTMKKMCKHTHVLYGRGCILDA
jgi:hypothetical protein